jgi:apolipoprotein N-acyltransferase
MPFSNWIPQLNGIVQGVGDFKPGHSIDPLCWNHHCFGILICYEAIHKDLARRMVHAGAEFLVNITNDAWFGDTNCPEQHLMLASFRAVENRVYLVRCANTGISAVVDPLGRISERTSLFNEALRVETIRLANIPSVYQKWGDWLPRLCSLISFIVLGISLLSFWKQGG